MLIKRVYELDPLTCPECGGQMAVVAFIEPPQAEVIEKILRGHQSVAMVGGLWRSSAARAPPANANGDAITYHYHLSLSLHFTCPKARCHSSASSRRPPTRWLLT